MSDSQAIVNIDYIATVVENNGRLELRSYNTNVPIESVKRLREMMEDKDSTLIHMQNEVASVLAKNVPVPSCINYLAPISCSSAYVTETQYPEEMSCLEYEQALVDAEESAEKALKERLSSLYPEDINKRENNFIECVTKERLRARKDKVKFFKTSYFYSARRYLYAWYYQNALEVNLIKRRLNRDVKMYSTDTIGFTHFKYPISNDVEIKIHTNFGYGTASFFRLELTYKGVPILPYSFYVNYYHANSRELARYTRLYLPDRDNWDKAFKFVVETANLAAQDPKRFVCEWVMDEVGRMIDGLLRIMENPAKQMDAWLDKMNEANHESPYLHVRHMDQGVASEYKCYPDEMLIDFKAKKISGAIDFIDSLKALKPIYNDVDRSIDIIKKLGRDILPEIKIARGRIRKDISDLKISLRKWQVRRKKSEDKIAVFEAKCRLLVTKRMSNIIKQLSQYEEGRIEAEIRAEFEHDNPEFEEEKREKNLCLVKETKIEDDISKRERFDENLKSCESKISASRL